MCLILLTGLSGLNFHFLPNGDGVPQYKILNFRQTSPGQFAWQMVGTFEENQLKVRLCSCTFCALMYVVRRRMDDVNDIVS